MTRRGVNRIPLFLLARVVLVVGIGLTVSSLAVVAYATDLLESLENETVDARFSVRGDRQPPTEVVLVKIDDRTFQALRMEWPFPRRVHARTIEHISGDRPRAIAYDVQFSEPSTGKDDAALLEAIGNARGRVVLATSEIDVAGRPAILGGAKLLRDVGAKAGNGLFPDDPGAAVRRVAEEVDGLKSLSLVAAETARDRAITWPGGGSQWIDYRGPPGTFQSVSLSEVARQKTPRGFFRDKAVVVGATAPSLQDVHPTSVSGDRLMSGAEIQANALATALADFPLRDSTPVDVALIMGLGLLAPLASLRLRPLAMTGLVIGVGVAFVVGAQLAFNSGLIVPFVYPLIALVATSFATVPVRYLTGAFDRARDLFSRFVPAPIVDQVLGARGEPTLGGVRLEGTVMFADVRGFSGFAEALPAERVVEVLNRYLAEMSEAILGNGGTLVSYMGDGIMAVFGAPVEHHDHADRALAATREMLDERLPRFNGWLHSRGLGEEFRVGVGLNSGSLISGTVGSARRLEYAAIGDTTNTAARLQEMTKGTSHQVFLSEATRSMLRSEVPDLVYVDELELRGKQAAVKVWSISEDGHGPGAGTP